jgi:hypothetical protein
MLIVKSESEMQQGLEPLLRQPVLQQSDGYEYQCIIGYCLVMRKPRAGTALSIEN